MTRLLLHSYHFPPIGGSGAQRPLKMVRALTRLGYESVVVTGGGATTDPWAPEDVTLAAEIPPQIEVRRLPSTDEPEPAAQWRAAASRWLGIKEPWSKWWVDGSFRLGLEAGAGVDLIYVWMQPYASAAAGALLARELNRPWVADLGDPWALDEMMAYPSALHRQLDRGRMRRVLGTAAAIVMSTPEAVARLRKEFPELAARPVVAISNGYDAADFASEPPPLNNQKFRIVHTGYLHTALGRQHQRYRHLRRALRGSVPGLDILTRSHVYLVEAIDRLIDRDPELANVLELHLAGVMSQVDRDVAVRSPVTTLHGYLTHADAISLMRTADTLFLPMQTLPEGVRATIVPGLDILTRSHVYLVEAIDRLIDRDPELANVLELHLAGVMSQVDRDVAVRSPVTTLHGYLTHADAISLMRTADTLFLPMQNLPEGVRATIVPGKMYEYLASGRPILAALPDGDARDILEQAGNATLVRPDDVDGIANGILGQLERFRAGVQPTPPDRAVVERFEYGKLGAELASVFETVLRRP